MNDNNDRFFVVAVAILLALIFFYIVGKGMITIFGGGA